MFNKALEVIETKEFFGFTPEQIEVIVHPQSLVHALVGFQDGALMAHVGPPDMRHAIGYALHWPSRKKLPVDRLDLAKISQLTFSKPDPNRYPALELAQTVMRQGGLSGAVFNAAKEQALDAFIAEQIGFMDMARLVEAVLEQLGSKDSLINDAMTLDNVNNAERTAKRVANELVLTRAF